MGIGGSLLLLQVKMLIKSIIWTTAEDIIHDAIALPPASRLHTAGRYFARAGADRYRSHPENRCFTSNLVAPDSRTNGYYPGNGAENRGLAYYNNILAIGNNTRRTDQMLKIASVHE